MEEHGTQLERALVAQLLVFVQEIVLAVVEQQLIPRADVLPEDDAGVCGDLAWANVCLDGPLRDL